MSTAQTTPERRAQSQGADAGAQGSPEAPAAQHRDRRTEGTGAESGASPWTRDVDCGRAVSLVRWNFMTCLDFQPKTIHVKQMIIK